KLRSPLRQEAWMKQAECYIRLDKADDAIKSLKGLLEEFPQSRYLERAETTIADILVRTGKAADAATFLEAEESKVAKLPESTAIVERVKLNKAKAILATGDTKKAKTEAGTLAGGSGAAAGGAKVLLAQISVAEKSPPAEAEKLYRDALKT